MNDFDFNISQNGQGFQGDQNIVLGDINNKNNMGQNLNNNNNVNDLIRSSSASQEKPSSSGVVNVPITEENQNKNIDISANTAPEEIEKSTLDEPIITTLKRDLYAIFNKIKYVAVPKMTDRKLEELYNWDLWGPLLFCFLYSIALSTGENDNNESSIFVLIFVIFWIGGLVITFNEKFLGAEIGLFQMVSLLGYGMFPITLGGIIIGFCKIRNIWIKFIIVVIALVWASLASIGFLGRLVEQEKRFIAVFPVFLFLLSLSMFALNY